VINGLLYPARKQEAMSLVVRERIHENMSEGLHSVTITKVEDLGLQETRFGMKECAAIYFTAHQKEGKPVDVRLRVVKSLHPESSLVRLLTALSVPFGDTFDLTDLVGIKCQVVIQHKEKEGKTYANIAAVLKLRNRRRSFLHRKSTANASRCG
jgi:hypothetical protein